MIKIECDCGWGIQVDVYEAMNPLIEHLLKHLSHPKFTTADKLWAHHQANNK